jgi:hypothetical protein
MALKININGNVVASLRIWGEHPIDSYRITLELCYES